MHVFVQLVTSSPIRELVSCGHQIKCNMSVYIEKRNPTELVSQSLAKLCFFTTIEGCLNVLTFLFFVAKFGYVVLCMITVVIYIQNWEKQNEQQLVPM